MSISQRVKKELRLERESVIVRRCINNSGGTLERGDVVVRDTTNATADLPYIINTTTADDPNVAGMVYDSGVADGAECWVQIEGPTDALKAHGGAAGIARGDLLSSYTADNSAALAAAGSAGVFAQAYGEHETGATVNATAAIDAYIRVGW